MKVRRSCESEKIEVRSVWGGLASRCAPMGIKWLLVKEDSTLYNMTLERFACMQNTTFN